MHPFVVRAPRREGFSNRLTCVFGERLAIDKSGAMCIFSLWWIQICTPTPRIFFNVETGQVCLKKRRECMTANMIANMSALLHKTSVVGGGFTENTNNRSGSRGPWGPGSPSPLPQDLVKIMQFSGNFKGKTPMLSKSWAQDLRVKTKLVP